MNNPFVTTASNRTDPIIIGESSPHLYGKIPFRAGLLVFLVEVGPINGVIPLACVRHGLSFSSFFIYNSACLRLYAALYRKLIMSSNNAERHDRMELTLEEENCFLVGAEVPGRYARGEDPLSELAALVDTAGAKVVGQLTQKLDHPHKRYYLNKGKFYDLVDMARESGANTIVVDDDISPNQLSSIEEASRLKVIDRSEVILDIFASRARTKQAQMQVEMAQLQYQLPRLERKWTHLERLGGGIGTRGPGESQIESDRRELHRRISQLRSELDDLARRKEREVATRESSFTACLVGYTNAGKSSLLNKLTNAGTYVENQLFATLDTLTRILELPSGNTLMLSDTVGFIRRLPHHLVASFHATLEEARQANLLLHVIDAADPMALIQARSVDETLKKLGMADKDRVFLLNKCDAIPDKSQADALSAYFAPALVVSALKGDGIAELIQLLDEKSLAGKRTVRLRLSAGDGKRLALLNQVGIVLSTDYEESDALIRVTLEPADLDRLMKMPGKMEIV